MKSISSIRLLYMVCVLLFRNWWCGWEGVVVDGLELDIVRFLVVVVFMIIWLFL